MGWAALWWGFQQSCLMQQKAALLSNSVVFSEINGRRTSASPPSPDHIVLLAQFFPAAALWTTPLQGKKKKTQPQQKSPNNDALVRTSSAPWSDLQHTNNCSSRNLGGNVLWGQGRKMQRDWNILSWCWQHRQHLMKSKLNRWHNKGKH